MSILIPLTRNKSAIIDNKDIHFTQWKWYTHKDGYAVRKYEPNKTLFLHHCIIGRSLKGMDVDHINGNRLDNRRENLRFVSRRENISNNRKRRNEETKSKYVGVFLHQYKNKPYKYWDASIRVGKNRYFLGSFKTEQQASQAYQSKLAEVNNA